jgi:hypothetical protein
MRICAFCGGPGGNLEHIFAQWLIERMDATDYHVVVGLRKEDSLASRPAHRLNTYATRSVCEDCNCGWMSALEAWFQQNMGPLVEPAWAKLASEILRLALTENESLARWALKTVIMMDKNTMMNNVVSSGVARNLFGGEIPDGITIDIGHIHDANVGGIISQGFWVRNQGRPPEWQEHKQKAAFKAVIQLNHLAIRLFVAPSAKPTNYGPNMRFPLRSYPEAQDPDTVDYRFHDLFEFDRVLELEA